MTNDQLIYHYIESQITFMRLLCDLGEDDDNKLGEVLELYRQMVVSGSDEAKIRKIAKLLFTDTIDSLVA